MANIGGRIQGAAQQWAKARQLDLGDLNPSQQKQVIADVGAQLGDVSRLQVRDELLSLWVGTNEDQGKGLEQMGGGAQYQGGAEQRSVGKSALMAVRGGAAISDPTVVLGFEIALAGRRDGRVSVADVDDILAPFKAEGGLTPDQAETVKSTAQRFNLTDAAQSHLAEQVVALQSDDVKPPSGVKKLVVLDAVGLFNQAGELYRAGDEAGAAALYEKLLAVDDPRPRLAGALNLSVMALRRGDFSRVVELAEEQGGADGAKDLSAKLWSLASAAHRSLGNTSQAYDAAATSYAHNPTPSARMDLAIHEKLKGNLPTAIELLRTAVNEGAGVTAQSALAGYLVLDGKVAEGQQMFDALKPDPENPTGYYMNAAWFSALKDDKPAVLEHVSRSLLMATDKGHRNVIAQYFEAEVDLAKYKNDPDFRALLDAAAASA